MNIPLDQKVGIDIPYSSRLTPMTLPSDTVVLVIWLFKRIPIEREIWVLNGLNSWELRRDTDFLCIFSWIVNEFEKWAF